MTEVQSVEASKLSSLTGSWQFGSWQQVEFVPQSLEMYLLPELCPGGFLCDADRREDLYCRKILHPPEGQQVAEWAGTQYLLQGFHVISSTRKQGDAGTALILNCTYFSSIPQGCQYIARETGVWRHLHCWGVLTVFLLREEKLRHLLRLQRSDFS